MTACSVLLFELRSTSRNEQVLGQILASVLWLTLHKEIVNWLAHNLLAPPMRTMEHILPGVTLNGKHPILLHPHEQPDRCLGAALTLTLSWQFQLEAVKLMLHARARYPHPCCYQAKP